MRRPVQPKVEDFLPSFMGVLFGANDGLRVSEITRGPGKGDVVIQNHALPRDEAVGWVLTKNAGQVPNLYFAAGVHDGGGAYAQANFTKLPAIYVDLDAGAGKPFHGIDDAVAFLLTHPMRATGAWVTGHGVQAAFVLETPLPFTAGTPEADHVMQVWRQVNKAFLADACDGPQHLFRVPMTINEKPEKGKKEGFLLWWKPTDRWTLERLEAESAPWIGDPSSDSSVPAPVPANGESVPYEELPQDIRDEIESDHGDRSQEMFSLVAKLAKAGYSESTIQMAMSHGVDFAKKYGLRLPEEVDRCLRKITHSPWRASSDKFTPLPIRYAVTEIPLRTCGGVPPELEAMVQKYAEAFGVQLQPWVMHTVQFHEHVVATQKQGVLLAPCGAGKSTWALSHIAAHAKQGVRYIYVVETVRQLYEVAGKLEKLTDVPVGRVHAFNAEKCKELCGKDHDWRQCSRDNPKAVCHSCPAKEKCAFFNRPAEEAKPILVMTHAGLVRLMETGSKLLEDAHVIVDEHLELFADWEVSEADLKLVQSFSRVDLPWGELVPYSRATTALAGWGLASDARTFAARNYIYRDAAALDRGTSLYDSLRQMLASSLSSPDPFKLGPAEEQRAYEVLATLVNVMRQPKSGGGAYSFCEERPKDPGSTHGWRYHIRKERCSLEADGPWASFWILNASAMLSAVKYPEGFPVYTCPEIPDASHLLRLHVVIASPTKAADERKLYLTAVSQLLSGNLPKHKRVMIATAKDGAGLKELEEVIGRIPEGYPRPQIEHMTRGRIRGANTAGDCSVAILATMPLFTQVTVYALQAALLLKRTIRHGEVFDKTGDQLQMRGGRFSLPAMQECYALGALDELYQAAWRAAVRNGAEADVVIAIPDEAWMIALWETVMPRARVASAYRQMGPAAAKEWREKGMADLEKMKKAAHMDGMAEIIAMREAALAAPVFEADERLPGLQSVIDMPAGERIGKPELAARLGYAGKHTWKENKERIMTLVAPWMEEAADNVQELVRRGRQSDTALDTDLCVDSCPPV